MLAALAATTVAWPLSVMAAPAHSGLMNVGSRRLWVLDNGARSLPALLYVHGGPGIGSFDFERYLLPQLLPSFRVVSVDQRGTLRSDPIGADEPVTVADLIADYEAIRTQLGITSWTLLGHSFGGLIALRYALAHPGETDRLVLESPVIDVASSFRWLCAGAAQILNGIDTAAALEAVTLSNPATPVGPDFVPRMEQVLKSLGERRQDLYVAQNRHRNIFSRLAEEAPFPATNWSRGQTPGRALLQTTDLYQPMLDQVASLASPPLLVRGAADHVTSPAEVSAVEQAGGDVVTVPEAGHFVHVEQPAAMAALLRR